MRIAVVGGGPAGLYFAILMRARGLADHVTVYEKNAPGATFGWGIVFSGRTLEHLANADRPSHAALRDASVEWQQVVVVLQGERVEIGGNDFVGIERLAFLDVLRARCVDLGVDLRFRAPVTDPHRLVAEHDLVIGADGVGSAVRLAWSDAFGPHLDERHNWYAWLGTTAAFDGLTMIFRTVAAGTFIAHAYRYAPGMSTFVVECDPATYAAAGLGRRDEEDALAYLAGVFRDELGGAPLLGKDYRWIRFIHLTNDHWFHKNVALMGDALHTAHFSIGSGTKLALEDAIALADVFLEERRTVPDALAAWEARRAPDVAAYQEAALSSLRWLEDLGDDLSLAPLPFAYKVMTRSGRVDLGSLERRDPGFVGALQAWRRGHGQPPLA